MNAQTVALLHGIVRRESLSMLSYIGQAFPWTSSRGAEALAKLGEVCAAHREAVAALGRYLAKLRQPVASIGSYPASFTTLNFLSLEHVLPRLVASEVEHLTMLQQTLASV